MAKASTNGSSAVTPVTSANASPVTSRSSITQNDSFVSDIADPPLSATGSVVSDRDELTWWELFWRAFALEVGESPAHIHHKQQQQFDSERPQDGVEHLIDRGHDRIGTAAEVRKRAIETRIGSEVRTWWSLVKCLYNFWTPVLAPPTRRNGKSSFRRLKATICD